MKVLVSHEPQVEYTWPDDVTEVRFDPLQPVPKEHRDAEACVSTIGSPRLQEFLDELPNLRWFQSYAAGPDPLMRCNLPDQLIVTNGIHFHDRTVAEHALAQALYLVRDFGAIAEAQRNHVWDRSQARIRPLGKTGRLDTLIDANVVVWGFGAIGQRIAKLFSALDAKVTGVARSAGERAGFPVIATEDLPDMLPHTDVLVMVLPDSPTTRGVLNEDVLAALPKHAFVINVGRGSAVDQDALVKALHEGTIAGASLDVTTPEPLPEDSPLWDAPNMLITPHCAGCRPDGAAERVAHNLKALREGRIEDMIGLFHRPVS